MSLPERTRLANVASISSGKMAALLTVLVGILLIGNVAVTIPAELRVVVNVFVLFLLYGLVVLGLNLQFGQAGLVNFGPVAFFMVGGYTMALLTASNPLVGVGLNLPWPVGLAGAIVTSAVLGAVIGYSTLQLRDDFLAIVTLATAEIIHDLVVNFNSVTGGQTGLLNVPQPINQYFTEQSDTILVVTALVLVTVVLLVYTLLGRLSSGAFGRIMRAIRADTQVTKALGKPTLRYKIIVFIYGSIIAGFGGALYVMYQGAAAPGFFVLNVTVIVWAGMLIGGAGNYLGALAGVGIIMSLRLGSRFLIDYIPMNSAEFAYLRMMFIGLLLVLVIRFRPEGLWGNPDEMEVVE